MSLQQHGDQWLLRVADDGVGIDLAKRHNPTAHGLVSMRERTNALGGEFSIQGKAGRGTVVEIRRAGREEIAVTGTEGRPRRAVAQLAIAVALAAATPRGIVRSTSDFAAA